MNDDLDTKKSGRRAWMLALVGAAAAFAAPAALAASGAEINRDAQAAL